MWNISSNTNNELYCLNKSSFLAYNFSPSLLYTYDDEIPFVTFVVDTVEVFETILLKDNNVNNNNNISIKLQQDGKQRKKEEQRRKRI